MNFSPGGPRSVAPIPRILHAIWIGDESRRPDRCLNSWRDMHPGWEFRLWGNAEYRGRRWKSHAQMEIFHALGRWEGIADLMRYEILQEHGGVYVDADSICVRPLDDWLLDLRLFAIWESERHRPGLIANGFIGCIPGHPAMDDLVAATARMARRPFRRSWRSLHLKGLRLAFVWDSVPAWQIVGPLLFTRVLRRYPADDVTVLPSVMFLPKHFLDAAERASSMIYSRHEWGTTQILLGTAPRPSPVAAPPDGLPLPASGSAGLP